ncbi:unnamed protein product, partial [Staurois parvus]
MSCQFAPVHDPALLVPLINAHQCHLSVPISATYQCP